MSESFEVYLTVVDYGSTPDLRATPEPPDVNRILVSWGDEREMRLVVQAIQDNQFTVVRKVEETVDVTEGFA